MKSLSASDWEHLAETYDEGWASAVEEGIEYEGEDVMTSIGYVFLDPDGTVYSYGQGIGNVEYDGPRADGRIYR